MSLRAAEPANRIHMRPADTTPARRARRPPPPPLWCVFGALGLAATLAGCGERKPEASQVAARVNGSDITVHQINFLLQRDRTLAPEQAEAAGRRVLELLIDQELAVQRAIELKLDRDPQTVQALEAARREVLARAYRDRVMQGGARPTPDEVRRYYDATPALFGQRRVYSLQELLVEAPPPRQAWVKEQLARSRSADEFAQALRQAGLRFSGSQSVKPAERLPLGLVERFAAMKDGDAAVLSEGQDLRVVFIAASRLEPVTLERAGPAIEQYLANQTARRAIDDDLKALRTAASISYQGKFAAAAPARGSDGVPAAASAPSAEGSPDPLRLSMPDAAPPPGGTGSAIDPELAKKGMGLQ